MFFLIFWSKPSFWANEGSVGQGKEYVHMGLCQFVNSPIPTEFCIVMTNSTSNAGIGIVYTNLILEIG